MPPRNGLATPAVIAANAVMTGMPPNIAPYAAAVTHALCNPNFQVFNLQTTTNPVTPVIVVGGPSTEKNGFNNKLGALGSGNVNNASLGRTLKLCMRNIGGASAESGVDPATIGQPGKYTFCFAELEGVVHWPPLRSQTKNALGANHDAVTLIGVTGTANMIIKATSAQELIEMIAKSIRSVGSNDYMFGGWPLLVLCPEHAQNFENEKKLLERQRLDERTTFDLEMIETTGSCSGIENYSRYLSGRQPGEPPPTLYEYIPEDSLLFIDESHITCSQISGMYKGDFSRKSTLSQYGFRLPSCIDNRPLKREEWDAMRPQTIFVSATPGDYELEKTGGVFVEQVTVSYTHLRAHET